MNGDNSDYRLKIVFFVVILITCVLSFKLFQISVLSHSRYVAMADNQYSFKKEVPAERGRIYLSEKNVLVEDFNKNYPVALNIEIYDVNIIPRNVKNPKETAAKLAKVLSLNEEDLFNQINNTKPYLPPIIKGISKEIADEVTNLKLSGVFLSSRESRIYPEASLASQIIGFINAENKGQYGIEKSFNDQLSGKSGTLTGEKDTKGRVIKQGDMVEGQDGSDVLLTIDRNIQYMAEKKLAEGMEKYDCESGSIIVMDPKTGAIWAMANKPDFNINEFGKIAEEKKEHLFINPSVSSLYEPGSTIKTLIMAGAIEKGLVEPDTKETFGKSVTVQGYEIGTAEDKAFGLETMTDVLVHSDNVAMVWLGDKMGNDMVYEYIKGFGFGEKTNIELPSEQSGVIRDKEKWRDINRATITFGQGMSSTPLQLILSYSALANGGKLMQPYLVKAIKSPDGKITETQPKEIKQIVSAETATKISAMMVEIVERGTGRHAKVEGYKTAAKTGTAQVPNPDGGYFDDSVKIGTLAGFVPAEDPKYVMLVKLDKPKKAEWGETSAGPVFGEMSKWLINYLELKPSLN